MCFCHYQTSTPPLPSIPWWAPAPFINIFMLHKINDDTASQPVGITDKWKFQMFHTLLIVSHILRILQAALRSPWHCPITDFLLVIVHLTFFKNIWHKGACERKVIVSHSFNCAKNYFKQPRCTFQFRYVRIWRKTNKTWYTWKQSITTRRWKRWNLWKPSCKNFKEYISPKYLSFILNKGR